MIGLPSAVKVATVADTPWSQVAQHGLIAAVAGRITRDLRREMDLPMWHLIFDPATGDTTYYIVGYQGDEP